MASLKLLLFSDTHLGFDFVKNPRVQKHRRYKEFFDNTRQIIASAISSKVDAVVHTGDLFYRSKIPISLSHDVYALFNPFSVENIPVYIVPGNHERSRLPHELIASASNIHVFNKVKSYVFKKNGMSIRFSGFPYQKDIQHQFKDLVNQLVNSNEDFHFLCIHQLIQGSKVGISDYEFKNNDDIIPIQSIPGQFDAVFSGHVHRAQILWYSDDQSVFKKPVIFPGAVSRTSFAECYEPKGYFLIDIELDKNGTKWIDPKFIELENRRMYRLKLSISESLTAEMIDQLIKKKLDSVPSECNVLLSVSLENANQINQKFITSDRVRSLCPVEMNLTLRFDQ